MSFITETSAFFIENKALFGAFPTQLQISQLEEWGVELIVNLTSNNEKKIKPYFTKCKVIQYSIPDREVPNNLITFYSLVLFLSEIIKNNKKIYIHCKGGHGRSSLLVCVLICFIYKIPPKLAFKYTSKFHASRLIHSTNPKKNEYWKNKGFPQFKEQKIFVVETFQKYSIPIDSPFYIKNNWLSNCGLYDNYLLKTGLGFIIGKNGEELEKYRNNLFLKKAAYLFV